MKKIMSLLCLLVVFTVVMTGCGNNSKNTLNTEEKNTSNTQQTDDMTNEAQEPEVETEKEKADDTTNEIQDTEKGPIEVDVNWTKDEITNALGEDYTFETHEDGAYFLYYSMLEYDDLYFYFYHDTETVPSDAAANLMGIKSNKYKVKDLDVEVGDSYKEAWEYCDANFKHAYDHHSDEDVFDRFYYKDTYYWTYFGNDKDYQYMTQEEIDTVDSTITYIELFAPVD